MTASAAKTNSCATRPNSAAKFGEDWLKIRIAEVRFRRAYAYFQLCRVYGGVILRTEVDGPEQNDKARSTEEECWGFIINELKELAPDLPLKWDSRQLGPRHSKSRIRSVEPRSALR